MLANPYGRDQSIRIQGRGRGERRERGVRRAVLGVFRTDEFSRREQNILQCCYTPETRGARGRRTLSTSTTWKVLVFSGCQIATFLWPRSASRRRRVRTSNWSCRVCGAGEVGAGLAGVGGGLASSPATNMTGASCTSSSGGYEFITPSCRWKQLVVQMCGGQTGLGGQL